MPLYDCVLLAKPRVNKEDLMKLLTRIGELVYRRNGVFTEIESFGTVQLGYGIKKLDGRHFQGQLLQMTMMATPNINKELQYLNKEDKLLRWLLVKHRDVKFGHDFFDEDDVKKEFSVFSRSSIDNDDDDEDADEHDDNDDEEYQPEGQEATTERE